MGENDLIVVFIQRILRIRHCCLLDIQCSVSCCCNRKVLKGYDTLCIGNCRYAKRCFTFVIKSEFRTGQWLILLIYLGEIEVRFIVPDLHDIAINILELRIVRVRSFDHHELIPCISDQISIRSLDFLQIVYVLVGIIGGLKVHIILTENSNTVLVRGDHNILCRSTHRRAGLPLHRLLVGIIHLEGGALQTLQKVIVIMLEDLNMANGTGSTGVRLHLKGFSGNCQMTGSLKFITDRELAVSTRSTGRTGTVSHSDRCCIRDITDRQNITTCAAGDPGITRFKMNRRIIDGQIRKCIRSRHGLAIVQCKRQGIDHDLILRNCRVETYSLACLRELVLICQSLCDR